MSNKPWKFYDMVINGLPQRVKYNEDTVNQLFLPLLRKLTQIQRQKQRKIMAFLAAPPELLQERLIQRKIQGGLPKADAVKFYETSDRLNIERILNHTFPADEQWQMVEDGDFIRC